MSEITTPRYYKDGERLLTMASINRPVRDIVNNTNIILGDVNSIITGTTTVILSSATVSANTTNNLTITNFDSFSYYEFTPSVGSVTQTNTTVSWTIPSGVTGLVELVCLRNGVGSTLSFTIS